MSDPGVQNCKITPVKNLQVPQVLYNNGPHQTSKVSVGIHWAQWCWVLSEAPHHCSNSYEAAIKILLSIVKSLFFHRNDWLMMSLREKRPFGGSCWNDYSGWMMDTKKDPDNREGGDNNVKPNSLGYRVTQGKNMAANPVLLLYAVSLLPNILLLAVTEVQSVAEGARLPIYPWSIHSNPYYLDFKYWNMKFPTLLSVTN